MNNYNEPWVVTEEDYIITGIIDSGGSPIIPHSGEEEIERIVACVNFCKGFTNASLKNMKSLEDLRSNLTPIKAWSDQNWTEFAYGDSRPRAMIFINHAITRILVSMKIIKEPTK